MPMTKRAVCRPIDTGDNLVLVLALPLARPALAEAVYVKYRGFVDLAPFEREWVSRSAVVNAYVTTQKKIRDSPS